MKIGGKSGFGTKMIMMVLGFLFFFGGGGGGRVGRDNFSRFSKNVL